MLIVPFDPAGDYIKGVEYANGLNQKDAKFELDQQALELKNQAAQDAIDRANDEAPFRLNALQRTDEAGAAAQEGRIADLTGRSRAAADSSDATYNTEVAARKTAEINAQRTVDEATLDFKQWNETGRDLSAFRKSNDATLANVVEQLRAVQASARVENLPALAAVMKQQVDNTTKVLANAVKTKDVDTIRDAMLINDRAKNVDAEVQAEVLRRASVTASTTASALQSIGVNAAAARTENIQTIAATGALQVDSAFKSALLTNNALEEKALKAEDAQALEAAKEPIKTFGLFYNDTKGIPTEPAARATFFATRATQLDTQYQLIQSAVGDQLPEGKIASIGTGLLFRSANGLVVPLSAFVNQYPTVFNYGAPVVPTNKGQTVEQTAANVARSNALAKRANSQSVKAEADAIAAQAKAQSFRLKGGGVLTSKAADPLAPNNQPIVPKPKVSGSNAP